MTALVRPRVLVVDDEPAIRHAVALALEAAGCHVLAADGGEAALALLAAEPVDVLLLDLRLPDLRGDVLFHLAAALQPPLARRSLFVTGDISARAAALIGGCGAPLVRKPFVLADLVETVFALLPDELDLGQRGA